MKRIIVSFTFICAMLISLNANASSSAELNEMTITCQKIVNNLFEVTGNKRFSFTAPKVEVKDEKKAVAAYYPLKNVIVIEKEAYLISRQFGPDSLSALAFLLAHELTHSFQMEIMKNKQSTNYMAYHNHYHGSHQLEKGADISGAFNAYLAGYKTEGIIGPLINNLYDSYNLSDHIDNYPSREERAHTAEEVDALVKELIMIFESAAYLTSIGEFQFAASSYEYILQYYQGKEIYNNLGVCYAMQAMTFENVDYDLYLFPFELDQNSRIKMPKKSRGGKDSLEKRVRMKYLRRALDKLEEAISMDQTYFAADINVLCVKILLEEFEGAIEYYKSRGMSLRGEMEETKTSEERARLALAIATAKLNDEAATAMFQDLQKSDSPLLAYMAKYNERIFLEGTCGAPEEFSCVNPIDVYEIVDGVALESNVLKGKEIQLHEEDNLGVFLNKKRNSVVYRFVKNDETRLTLQIVPTKTTIQIDNELTEEKKLKVINSNKGSFMVCEDEAAVFSVNMEAGTLTEWAKYYYNY